MIVWLGYLGAAVLVLMGVAAIFCRMDTDDGSRDT